MFDYEQKKNKNSLRAHMPGTIPRRLRTTQKLKYSKQNIKLFLKLRYVCHSCVIEIGASKNRGHRAYFQAIVPQRATLPLSQARQHRKKPPLCLRALITRCACLSLVKLCAVRMRNAIPWNHLKRPFSEFIGEEGDLI